MQFATLLTLIPAIKAAGMAVPYSNAVAFAESLALQHGSEYANTMGEIAMLYPEDREWSEEAETIAPCGSYSGVENRTDFPLDDGFVALVAKSHEAWSVSLKITYDEDPDENSDFQEWANGNVTNEIDIGHTCFYMPDVPSSINTGDVATIQLEYMALDDSSNVTHYACSDIQFVEKSVFKVTKNALSCFNNTDNDYYSYSEYGNEEETTAASTDSSTSSATATATATSTTASSSSAGEGAVVKAISTVGLGALAVFVFNLIN